jgi:hypothetical protein
VNENSKRNDKIQEKCQTKKLGRVKSQKDREVGSEDKIAIFIVAGSLYMMMQSLSSSSNGSQTFVIINSTPGY